MQTLKQALHMIRTEKSRDLVRASNALNGLPEGGWPETRQAMGDVLDYLPLRSQRAYTLDEFVAAVYEMEDCGNAARRYRRRAPDPGAS